MCEFLPSQYQQFIHLSRYSRWLNDKKRRETWNETVTRYFDFFEEHLLEETGYKLKQSEREELEKAVLKLKVMPSMRALMTAGEALKRENVAGYNCAYIAIDSPRAFDEILYVLMNGTGVGFSVERQYVAKMPLIADEFFDTETTIVVADSKLGWAKAFKELISLLYTGQIPQFDLSRVRPAGSPLKTFGGRASGPEPLKELFEFCIATFRNAAGRRLQSVECHDIVCKIAEIVVVGGVRRSALLSLSNLSDDRMRSAKAGQWWVTDPQRALANNSACYTEKPDLGVFMDEWKSLYDSKSGERGIFSRQASINKAETIGRREPSDFGTNPCSEIILRSRQFCNLTEGIIRPDDTIETLKEKVRLATILGTFQCTLTNFKYLPKKWKENCEEERLLGVSLSGIMDNKLMSTNNQHLKDILTELRNIAIETNQEWSKKLKINSSVSITCVKPSGTVSQLVDCASGIHDRFAEHYLRTVRGDVKDPLCQMMMDMGFPAEPDVTKPESTMVFSFPMKAPKKSVFRNARTAKEQLELWKTYQDYWCEHKPSITVYVKEDEWIEVAAWVWKHFDSISGISFLPYSDHIYKQAPYQDLTKEEYDKLKKEMPENVDWSRLKEYEEKDHTVASQTYACSGGSCEIVDLV